MNYKAILSVLRFASDIVGKLPTKYDSVPAMFLKLLAIADSAQQRWVGSGSRIPSAFAHYDLVEATNEPFVRIFFGTRLKGTFKIVRWPLEPNRELLVATGLQGERFLFQEMAWGAKPYISPDFYHSASIDFVEVMKDLWEAYPRGLFLSTESSNDTFYASHEITYQEIPPIHSKVLTAKGVRRFEEVLSSCKDDIAAGIHRCYVASGPPGTGKSSFVIRLAQALGGRLLKLDASSIPRIGVKELSFLLAALRPRVLLIDDFDRAPIGPTAARLLFLLEHLKSAHAETMVVITVNDPTALDPAMLRSERIDEPIDFVLPDAEERRDLIGQLLPPHSKGDLERLVTETEGVNHADITDLCRKLLKEPIDRVLKMKKRLRAMAEAAANKNQLKPGDKPGDPQLTPAKAAS